MVGGWGGPVFLLTWYERWVDGVRFPSQQSGFIDIELSFETLTQSQIAFAFGFADVQTEDRFDINGTFLSQLLGAQIDDVIRRTAAMFQSECRQFHSQISFQDQGANFRYKSRVRIVVKHHSTTQTT